MNNNFNTTDRNKIKQKIVDLFNKNVKGKKSDTSKSNMSHDGKDGHWLEKQMGISHNASNTPDLLGFEMKNHTTSKTTFGDWSPNIAIFKKKDRLITRSEFLSIFGAPNLEKEGRFSWSGKPCPNIKGFNTFGQKLEVDSKNNILAIYSFKEDQRPNKAKIVPKQFQLNYFVLAKWEVELMKVKIERKFNNLGWFKCNKDKDGVYSSIVFGDPVTFENWIKDVKSGLIFFDSGMYDGNPRPYSQWRANNNYWDLLAKDRY